MRAFSIVAIFFITITSAFAQNKNISNGNVFDGEPYLALDPINSQHMVIAWMGYQPLSHIMIKTKVSFDGGGNWSSAKTIQHTNPAYGSADPSIAFDKNGNVFLAYIDYSKSIDSGSVYVTKSKDGGLNWTTPVEVINAYSDAGKFPIDRPWLSVDCSGGVNDGNVYITTMPPNEFGSILPPYHPYFIVSTDGGTSFHKWRYLDTVNWLAGNIIQQPMPTNCVSANGTFHAIYPSYMISQSFYAQYILASSSDAGKSFIYHSVFSSKKGITDKLPKKGYLLRSDPSDAKHLAFFYLDIIYGDLDVFMRESFDEGITWSDAIRINDDALGNNRMQDLVWADFDQNGNLIVAWRDRRNGIDSSYATSSEIWAAFRNKDSLNFSANFQLSDKPVAYDSILAYAGNDFMCIKLENDTLNAVWGDTRNGKLNIWFQRMSIDGNQISTHKISSENVSYSRIYPNPTHEILNIESKNLLKITVFNIAGKEQFTKRVNRSSRLIQIDIKNYPPGIYMIEVLTLEGIYTQKIIKE